MGSQIMGSAVSVSVSASVFIESRWGLGGGRVGGGGGVPHRGTCGSRSRLAFTDTPIAPACDTGAASRQPPRHDSGTIR